MKRLLVYELKIFVRCGSRFLKGKIIVRVVRIKRRKGTCRASSEWFKTDDFAHMIDLLTDPVECPLSGSIRASFVA